MESNSLNILASHLRLELFLSQVPVVHDSYSGQPNSCKRTYNFILFSRLRVSNRVAQYYYDFNKLQDLLVKDWWIERHISVMVGGALAIVVRILLFCPYIQSFCVFV